MYIPYQSDPSISVTRHTSTRVSAEVIRIEPPATDLGPTWYLDGALFSSDRGGADFDLYVDPKGDGTETNSLWGRTPGNDVAPAVSVVSADDETIAFVSTRDGNEEIYVANAAGDRLTRLTDDPADDGDPNWRP